MTGSELVKKSPSELFDVHSFAVIQHPSLTPTLGLCLNANAVCRRLRRESKEAEEGAEELRESSFMFIIRQLKLRWRSQFRNLLYVGIGMFMKFLCLCLVDVLSI